jgi:hypothetical protein
MIASAPQRAFNDAAVTAVAKAYGDLYTDSELTQLPGSDQAAACRPRHHRCRQRRWRRPDSRADRHRAIVSLPEHYIRPSDARATTTSRDLGL